MKPRCLDLSTCSLTEVRMIQRSVLNRHSAVSQLDEINSMGGGLYAESRRSVDGSEAANEVPGRHQDNQLGFRGGRIRQPPFHIPAFASDAALSSAV